MLGPRPVFTKLFALPVTLANVAMRAALLRPALSLEVITVVARFLPIVESVS